ncbi:putative rhomboid protein [Cyphellophora attinorum]|uniref:Rhomboid-type serine protease n=1 Tax=Cyphellophora attinorum TaxID=1664694 RepID=A0A0N1H6G2_9EURO|nr:putative rhomboid protein [Phialophora attinorum]KPI38295.1 putative rhomboid protein [Phialophora attinorum]
MASQDYYNSFAQPSRPNKPPPSSLPYTKAFYTPAASAQHSQSTLNHTFGQDAPPDPRYYGSSQSSLPQKPAKQSSTEMYTLPVSKISTNQSDLSHQNTHHPPSPEGRVEAQLLTESTGKDRKRKKKQDGWFRGKIPWVVYVVTMAQLTVFIVEIIRNSIVTGSPIMTKPSFNPMIGPSPYMLINMGARFVPCMRRDEDIQEANPPVTQWHCPSSTSNDPDDPNNSCDLSALCGFGGLDNQHPDQWFRFIVPIFLHAGIIHIAFNMLLQLTLGREIEKLIGSIRFALVYFFSGIFGFVLGANFAGKAAASTGASGALFGILAINLLDLIYHWQERYKPLRELMWLIAEIVVSFVLGLLPGLDNFAHIGGFLMGLVLGICILHSPAPLRKRMGERSGPPSTSPTTGSSSKVGPYHRTPSNENQDLSLMKPSQRAARREKMADYAAFRKSPLAFFKSRKPLWWGWWLLRAGALIGVLVGFVVLLNNFYKYHDTCSWCKYLSCLNISNWCELDNLRIEQKSPNTRRSIAMAGAMVLGGALL